MRVKDPEARVLVFDIETDGLLDELTKLLVIAIKDRSTGEMHRFDSDFEQAVEMLQDADVIVGHNIIEFDVPALQKLYPWFKPQGEVFDTVVATRMLWPDVKQKDFKLHKKGKLPGKLIGRHSLEAWGYRVGVHKDAEFSDSVDFKSASADDEMMEYCVQDVEVTDQLLDRILGKGFPDFPMEIDHEGQKILFQQKQHGFPFRTQQAIELNAELTSKRAALEREMQDMVGTLVWDRGEFTPKGNNKKMGYVSGAPLTKVTFTEFKPGSGDHIVAALQKLYGWEPKEYTEAGTPKTDEATLSQMDYPLAQKITNWMVLNKRIEQIAEGKGAWLKNVVNDRLHHTCLVTGTVTGRAAHMGPNLGQVPSARKPYGEQCRDLFTCDSGWSMVGGDLEGIELRCLAHYMAKWDDGAFANELLQGDIHWSNAKALGLVGEDEECDKENNSHHKWARDEVAKRFIYAFLYGAGPGTIGAIVGKGPKEGKRLQERFLAKFPALGKLLDALEKKVDRDGQIIGLDGRALPIRSKHAALNTLLQGAGGAIAKLWMVRANQKIDESGLRPYAQQLAYVHDELQWQVWPDYVDDLKFVLEYSAQQAGDDLGFRLPVDIGLDVGDSWANTH